MNCNAYYSNIDTAIGAVLLTIVFGIMKLLIPLKSTQDTPLGSYYGKCFEISHFRFMLNYYIPKTNYEISQLIEKLDNQFLLFCFVVKYLFLTVHAIGLFLKKHVEATTLC